MSIPPFGSPPTPNASTTVKGKVKLAQDLSGTADLPTVVSLSLSADTAINHKLTTVTDPTNPQDAATKAYVDLVAAGFGFQNKGASNYATAAALPANLYNNGVAGVGATLTGVSVGVLTVDGNAVALNDIIIVKDEATAANNGLYKVTTLGTALVVYVLTRATNMDQNSEVSLAYSFVTAGATNINKSYNVNSGTYTVGTTAINWNLFSTASTFIAGSGLDLTGNTFSVNVDTSTIEINSDTLRVKAGGIGANELASTTVAAASYTVNGQPLFTVDADGRLTAASSATITTGVTEDFAYFMGNY